MRSISPRSRASLAIFSGENLGRTIGTPCPIPNPTVPANSALINAEPDCQRVALLNFFQTRLNQDEGLPIDHPIKTVALLLKGDMSLGASSRLSTSYNFNHSRKENETFDVASYGASANGIEGDPARINVVNANVFTTFATNKLNEFHFTYSRESRPRTARESNLFADTGIGFSPSFRFGNPFFLQPNVDELIWRTQIKNNISISVGATPGRSAVSGCTRSTIRSSAGFSPADTCSRASRDFSGTRRRRLRADSAP